jgi:hypothetical protein
MNVSGDDATGLSGKAQEAEESIAGVSAEQCVPHMPQA